MARQRWTVPYDAPETTLVRYGSGALFTLGACGAGLTTLARSRNLAGGIAAVLLLGLMAVACWRIVLVGLYLGPGGVLVRHVIRSYRVPGPAVADVRIGQATGVDAWAIWLTDRRTGRSIEAPVWRAGGRDRHRNRVRLDPAEFARIVERLRAGAAAAQ